MMTFEKTAVFQRFDPCRICLSYTGTMRHFSKTACLLLEGLLYGKQLLCMIYSEAPHVIMPMLSLRIYSEHTFCHYVDARFP